MQCDPHEEVESLGKTLAKLIGLHSETLQLVHSGHVLAWNATLAGRRVRDKDVIHIVENLRGD